MKTKRKDKLISSRAIYRFVVPLLNAGACLSNIAFNLKQNGDLPKEAMASCDHWYREWDSAAKHVPKWIWNKKYE